MADATHLRQSQGLVAGKGDAYTSKVLVATYELASATAEGSTVDFGKVPSNARFLGASRLYWDDLTTTGSPTMDIGLAPVNSNITEDDDALSNGHALSSAGNALAISAPEKVGVYAWDLTTAMGVTEDPGGEFIVRGTVKDAGHTITGTVTLELHYYLD